MNEISTVTPTNFIREAILDDNNSGRFKGRVQTRFPPEPNGYLHIGHAKGIYIDFGMALDFNGKCNLRFDDTNPVKEDVEYVDSIKEDIKWLGYDWDQLFYASDYFEQLYEYAVILIKKNKAYVDDLSADEIREYRGTLTEPGKNSPYRERTVDENFELFYGMRNGEFPDGSRVLRAKIDMASGNMNSSSLKAGAKPPRRSRYACLMTWYCSQTTRKTAMIKSSRSIGALLVSRVWLPLFYKAFDQWITFLRVAH